MYQYITINQIIAIEKYKKYGYSIRTLASKANCSKSTTHRISKRLAAGLTPIEIFLQLETNQRKAGRKLIELNESDVKTVTYLLTKEGYAPDIISNNLRKTNPSNVSTKTLYNMFNTIGTAGIKVCYCEKVKINHIRKLKIEAQLRIVNQFMREIYFIMILKKLKNLVI